MAALISSSFPSPYLLSPFCFDSLATSYARTKSMILIRAFKFIHTHTAVSYPSYARTRKPASLSSFLSLALSLIGIWFFSDLKHSFLESQNKLLSFFVFSWIYAILLPYNNCRPPTMCFDFFLLSISIIRFFSIHMRTRLELSAAERV